MFYAPFCNASANHFEFMTDADWAAMEAAVGTTHYAAAWGPAGLTETHRLYFRGSDNGFTTAYRMGGWSKTGPTNGQGPAEIVEADPGWWFKTGTTVAPAIRGYNVHKEPKGSWRRHRAPTTVDEVAIIIPPPNSPGPPILVTPNPQRRPPAGRTTETKGFHARGEIGATVLLTPFKYHFKF